LVVVDWEGACLAPPEHDLFIFTDAGFEPFLQAYLRAGGRSELKPSTFVFYLYRRNLEDLADYIVRILYEENGAQVDLSYLDGVQDLIDSWPDLATAEQRMSAALAGALKGCWL
jgi:thiamine kinase-like enzyme